MRRLRGGTRKRAAQAHSDHLTVLILLGVGYFAYSFMYPGTVSVAPRTTENTLPRTVVLDARSRSVAGHEVMDRTDEVGTVPPHRRLSHQSATRPQAVFHHAAHEVLFFNTVTPTSSR